MRWVIELALAALVLGYVFYALSAMAPSPAYIASEREVTANAYFVLLRLSADPNFMALVEDAICANETRKQQVLNELRSTLDAVIPVRYAYNFTVYLDDVRPPTCRVCSTWGVKLASVARPSGFNATSASPAIVSAVLRDGTRVKLTLYMTKP
ncbi:hypothetical protein Pogu_2357 [Pyrobaculum oguniense TE7]|uniref:Uncharacterized protein n=1 Tax=Pyrobaculum oguniense (strain DSM 13380 / JCM 10595 / TE7) TaxID=698757 RepID=H6QBN3_PYROT|nr:hypothetical protein Pogu_2357 [Pyrobaculum oguniense TE7]